MNKRKGRGGSVRPQRQRSLPAEGVYTNAAFMHAAAIQLGNIARITTVGGQVWEGVFKTFSPDFDPVLEAVVRLEIGESSEARILPQTQMDSLIFKFNDVLNMTFMNTDLEYPTKDTFQTDTAISARINGNKQEEKELEPWDAGNINGNDNISLDLEASNGWDVQDMFRKNEQEYGVQSTFDHSLRGYTVPLQTSDTPDFREAQAKAEQIANEIEKQPAYKARLDLENGDEEATFAAVVRPNQDSNDKYIPPAKRKEQNNGKLVRSTPPPSSGSSSQNSPSPKDTRPPPVQYPLPPHVHQNSVHPIQNAHPAQHMPPIQHVMPPPHIQNAMMPPMSNMPPPVHAQPMPPMPQHVALPSHHPPRPNSHTPPHQYQQGPPPRHAVHHSGGPPHSKPQLNGDVKTNRPHRQQQNFAQMPERSQIMPPGHPQGPPQQMAYQEIKQLQDCPPHTIPQGGRQQQQQPHQQHSGPPPPLQSQETLKELQMFSKDFNLAPMATRGSPALPQQQVLPPHAQMQGPEGPQMGPAGQGSGASPNSNALNSVTDQNQATIVTQKEPSPAQSPPTSESEKLQNAVAKSKLNPNAKEFVLSPTAKPFQPRSPSTPSASRPHTPQTPSHNQYLATVSGPGGPSMPVTVVPMQYMTISQPQYQPPPPQANRLRKLNMNQMRPDMASQMQHAAAVTGQPLLAPAPIHQFIYNPQAAAAVHGMNQAAYQPATVASMHAAALSRMYDAAAVAAAAPTQIPYLQPQPSGTPTPAQGQYNPAAVQQQGHPQSYQPYLQTVPQQQAPPQIPMFCIPTQAHMLPNVPYLQQAPPPGPSHQHVQVLVQHQHPSQGGNPHGPNP